MEIHDITPYLKLLNLQPPLPGFEEFIGSYLFQGKKKALVDIGPRIAVPCLFSALDRLQVSPREIAYILLTHIHIDHAGGTGVALQQMPNATVIVHERGREHLVSPGALWEASVKTLGDTALAYGEIAPVPADRIMVAVDGMKLDLGQGLVLEIYNTPGHAPHHMSIFDRRSKVLLAGEAAGVCLGGRTRPATPPPFKLDVTLASLDKLIALAPEKLCYGHFGCYDHALSRLKSARESLLLWYGTVTEGMKEGKGAEEIMQLLREKDPNLHYLNTLKPAEYAKESQLLMNSVKGMMGAVRKSGEKSGQVRLS